MRKTSKVEMEWQTKLDAPKWSGKLPTTAFPFRILSAKKRTKTPRPAQKGIQKAQAASVKRASEFTIPKVQPAATKAKRPAEVETAFTPVEIDFFERAADMYADEYDVWDDFRSTDLN